MTTSNSTSYLLDTHAFIWLGEGDSRCSEALRQELAASQNLYLSVTSIWEMAIKSSLGKLSLQLPLSSLIDKISGDLRVETLPIKKEHCLAVTKLPFHHRDPFDRLLVSQALCEGLALVSRDRALDSYPVRRVW